METSARGIEWKVAVVTGGGRGIGRAVTLALAKEGAIVIPAGRNEASLRETAEAAAGSPGKVEPFPVDVADEARVRALFGRVAATHGRLDIFIGNAGIGVFKPILETSVEEWDKVCAVNLRGSFLCCREALRLMAPAKSGRIILISSVVGLKGYPDQGAYAASKHGVMGLAKVLAVEGQKVGVTVQAICPGGVDTDLVAQARPDLDRKELISPDDVADLILFMLMAGPRAVVDWVHLRRAGSAPFSV